MKHLRIYIMNIIMILTLLLLTFTPSTIAQEGAKENLKDNSKEITNIRLGVRLLEPFVTRSNTGYEGFSSELWDEIAKETGLTTIKTSVYNNAKELVDAVEKNEVDVAISAISITNDRENQVDFSAPMFNSGIAIMVPSRSENAGVITLFQEISKVVFSRDFLILLLILSIVIMLISHIIYFTEIKRNADFVTTKNYSKGIIEAFWWTITALFGQQDRHPSTKFARVIGLSWMIFGVLFLSFFTAQITSNLTTQNITSNIKSVTDLPGKKLGTIKGSTSEKYLIAKNFQYTTANSLPSLIESITSNKIDAIIYDEAPLKYFSNKNKDSNLTVLPGKITDENYGIAVGQNSTLRKKINIALLKIQENGKYKELVSKYFGE